MIETLCIACLKRVLKFGHIPSKTSKTAKPTFANSPSCCCIIVLLNNLTIEKTILICNACLM